MIQNIPTERLIAYGYRLTSQPCSHCGAQPGEKCRTKAGRETIVHAAREEATFKVVATAA